jgi:hypothetical protein
LNAATSSLCPAFSPPKYFRKTWYFNAVALTGNLDVHPEEDRLGRRRIAYCVVAKQLLLLRARSAAKARATSFFEPPTAGGFVRPRVG